MYARRSPHLFLQLDDIDGYLFLFDVKDFEVGDVGLRKERRLENKRATALLEMTRKTGR